jgi:hypothetical protein
LTPAELNEARIRSGRLGGRPRKPTVEEARREALDELTPRAIRVLREHLDEGGSSWRAALKIFEHQFGRAPEQPEERFVIPDSPDEIANLSSAHLLFLAGEIDDEMSTEGSASPPLSP